MIAEEVRTRFLHAALWHGTRDEADQILASHPEVARNDIHVAAVLGDESAVRAFLESDPASVHQPSAPYGGDPLTYLALSKYLRLYKDRSSAFVRTATALLDAGADPNAGFWNKGEHETVLYGAAGVAHHGELARLLIARGADPNDPEVVYHTPEDWDMDALRAVVESGRLTKASLSLMLLRKHDWHHLEGVQYLLDNGADPNFTADRWLTPLQHAIVRDNDVPIITSLLDHGADFSVTPKAGMTPLGMAARRGRGDILNLAATRGLAFELSGAEEVLAACATGDTTRLQHAVQQYPSAVSEVVADGGQILSHFAANDNAAGVRMLLDLGVPIDARFKEGDGYWDVAPNSTALHAASWRAAHETAKLLIDRGADVNALDAKSQSPLVLAIRACVDSYWTESRTPTTVAALLAAGATTKGLSGPCGYDAVDALIARYRDQ